MDLRCYLAVSHVVLKESDLLASSRCGSRRLSGRTLLFLGVCLDIISRAVREAKLHDEAVGASVNSEVL